MTFHKPDEQPDHGSSLSRRRLLQVGGIGAMGLSLPDLLQADELTQNDQGVGGEAKSCILIHQYGGLSQLDSWDMKPDAPQEIRGPYKPISTATPGFQVCELMPRLAQLSTKYAVVRSMTHQQSGHQQANSMYLAGRQNPANDDPSFGAMVTKLCPSEANVPASPNFRVRAFDAQGVTAEQLQERRRLLEGLQRHSPLAKTTEFDGFSLHQQRAFELLRDGTARQAFDVDKEDAKIRDRYGRNPLGQNLLLARRLIETCVRLVNVVAWTGLGVGEKFRSVETWDMHGNADVGIFEDGWNGLPFALPRTDQAVATLLEDLQDRGLLDSTLVVLVGEFGRIPVIRKGAKRIGRDHWPACYSAMLAGAGVQGGVVYGQSDKQAGYVKTNPVTLEDFTATLFAAMDINPASRLSPDGFTGPASSGNPIAALLKSGDW